MQNILAALYKLHNPNAYAYGGFVYTDKPAVFPQPEGFDMLTQYEDLKAIGFDGIKMLETKPAEQKEYQVRVDDEAYEEFFSACERDETHMVWHVADPDTFWDIERIPPEFIDYFLLSGYFFVIQNYNRFLAFRFFSANDSRSILGRFYFFS